MTDKSWQASESWRGTVGIIKPTYRGGSIEELTKLLPDGIGVTTVHLDLRAGTRARFESSIPEYEEKVKLFSEIGVNLVHPAGAPPFFLLGHKGESELIERWERDYGVEVFTNGTCQINAMKVFGVKRFIGFSYFRGEMNQSFGDYFRQAGFDVADMQGYDTDFDKVQTVSSKEVYKWIKHHYRQHAGIEGIYMLGPAWKTLDIIDILEQDLGIPVIHHIPTQSWEVQRRLLVRQPITGYGRLLSEMPPLPGRAY